MILQATAEVVVAPSLVLKKNVFMKLAWGVFFALDISH